MNGLPYYKAYPRDFIEGTVGMPFEVKCAYRVVLDLIYMQGGHLPDDARYISGLLGCSIRKWKSIREGLVEAGKLHPSGEFLTNYRAVSELETLAKLQDKQRQNASGPRKNKGLEEPRPNHTEPDTDKEKETPTALTPPTDLYAFQASTIRLTAKNLAQWRLAFPHLSVESELLALDEWAGEQGGNWFHAVAGAMAKKERQARERINVAAAQREGSLPRRVSGDGRI